MILAIDLNESATKFPKNNCEKKLLKKNNII